MAEYERVSAQIYAVLLRYASAEDIHVYSIDESFIFCDPYLDAYRERALELGMEPARLMAVTIIRDVLAETGITATVGIGTNMYLAKVAMDIVAKKAPPDENGARIAELNEESYRYLLWDHRPLTDFWQLGPGKAARLHNGGIHTMGEAAARSQTDEEWFYRTFGIDGEILIDHAWGRESVTIKDIKSYHTDSHSISNGQVLPRPYSYEEARNVFLEMVDVLCADLFEKHLVSPLFTWWVSYDYKSLEKVPDYDGRVALDFYGRLHPVHSTGTARMRGRTNSPQQVSQVLAAQFDACTDRRLLYRRLGICACDVKTEGGCMQLDLFTDYDAQEKERKIRSAMRSVRTKYGANALFTGKNLWEGATTLERNLQIGGHRA